MMMIMMMMMMAANSEENTNRIFGTALNFAALQLLSVVQQDERVNIGSNIVNKL